MVHVLGIAAALLGWIGPIEDAVIHLTRGLEKRIGEGEFTLARRDQ